jgi:hypothetical protein
MGTVPGVNPQAVPCRPGEHECAVFPMETNPPQGYCTVCKERVYADKCRGWVAPVRPKHGELCAYPTCKEPASDRYPAILEKDGTRHYVCSGDCGGYLFERLARIAEGVDSDYDE